MIVSTCMIQWLFFVIVAAVGGVAFVAVDDVDGVAVALYRAFVSFNDVVVDNLSAVAVVILNVVVALILTMFAVVIL